MIRFRLWNSSLSASLLLGCRFCSVHVLIRLKFLIWIGVYGSIISFSGFGVDFIYRWKGSLVLGGLFF